MTRVAVARISREKRDGTSCLLTATWTATALPGAGYLLTETVHSMECAPDGMRHFVQQERAMIQASSYQSRSGLLGSLGLPSGFTGKIISRPFSASSNCCACCGVIWPA